MSSPVCPAENPAFSPTPNLIDDNTTLDSLHVTDANIGDVACELRSRFGGIALNMELMRTRCRMLSAALRRKTAITPSVTWCAAYPVGGAPWRAQSRRGLCG